jgi:NAD(P)-dependent dehydrogenase (short-subunit alcohol dehydrogenase family)
MAERGWALVTGAGGRIGRALALAAGEAGYDVIVHHRTSKLGADETVAAIEAMGRRARASAAELTDPGACRALIETAERPITLLVNSASLFADDVIETLTPEAWNAVMAVNALAPLLLAQAFAAALPADREGLIVNITDQRVWRLNPRFFSYTMAKAALWAATQTLAQALAPRIRVNAIGPGPTIQSIHQTTDDFAAEAAAVPLGHGPAPAEIGHALRYLIDAPSVTGQMIAVDGGQHLAWRTPDAII